MTGDPPVEEVAGRYQPPLSSGVLGMLLLLATEAMFFAGLISAYLVSRANAAAWPPPDQPRLPVATTAGNTAVLLLSAVTLAVVLERFGGADRARWAARRWLALTAASGAAFLLLQGREWARLIRFGLTAGSSIYGGFFYVIVGMHGLHVLAGLVLLTAVLVARPGAVPLVPASLYWFFVVGLWPVLYVLVYLM